MMNSLIEKLRLRKDVVHVIGRVIIKRDEEQSPDFYAQQALSMCAQGAELIELGVENESSMSFEIEADLLKCLDEEKADPARSLCRKLQPCRQIPKAFGTHFGYGKLRVALVHDHSQIFALRCAKGAQSFGGGRPYCRSLWRLKGHKLCAYGNGQRFKLGACHLAACRLYRQTASAVKGHNRAFRFHAQCL